MPPAFAKPLPFSAVTTITNASRGAGNASVSVSVAYKEDTDRASQILKDIVAEMRREPDFRMAIRGDLELWGVDKVDGQFTAHAWLVHNGRVLSGGTEMESYKLLAAWATRHARGRFERNK